MRAQLTRILGRSLAIVMIVAAVLAGAGCESESRCTGTKTYVIVEEGRSVQSGDMSDLVKDKATIHRYLGAA